MIFVTVGTHEQQFNRLIEYVDKLKKDKIISDEIIMQIGYSTYEPQYCKWNKLISYDEMLKNVRDAKIVITHGGPASFIMPLQEGKIPIVVPRQLEFNEHVNNHQLEFIREISQRTNSIIPVIDIEELKECIINYDSILSNITSNIGTNNKFFNKKIENIVEELNNK